MKQELENKRPDSEERRSIWQRWKQNLKDWVWFCKEHPDWLDLDVQTWVSTHIGQPLRRRWHRLRELRHQNRQRQLPETEWKLGQLLLFLWGSLPRMGSDLRERLTRRRKGGHSLRRTDAGLLRGHEAASGGVCGQCRGGDGRGGVPVHVYHRRHRPL